MNARAPLLGPLEHQHEGEPLLEGPIKLLLDLLFRDVPQVVVVRGPLRCETELLHHVLCPCASLGQRLKLLRIVFEEVSEDLNVEVFEF